MNYPLISEYIEAIKSAEDNFEELSYLRPVLDDDGLPVMTSGNFAVVFKMKNEQSGKFYAVKCFTKEQEGRAEAYREIAKELKARERFTAVAAMVRARKIDLSKIVTDQEAFLAQLDSATGAKTMRAYLWRVCGQEYDEQHQG